MYHFHDQTILVTGGGRGIGWAIAQALAARGAKVFAADLDACDEEIAEGVVPIRLDITDETSIAQALSEHIADRPLAGLVNAAGILDAIDLERLDMERHRRVLDVNLDGALRMSRACLPMLRLGAPSSIVNVGSIMGLFGLRDAISYSCAKAALLNATRNLAVELAPDDIRVNALAPGFVSTRMSLLPDGSSEYDTEEFREVYLKHRRLPIGRPATADEMTGPALFLLSSAASYVTGHVLVADGGVTATY